MQKVFIGEVRLVDEAGTVNAMALGYIYGLTDAAFQIANLDVGSQVRRRIVIRL